MKTLHCTSGFIEQFFFHISNFLQDGTNGAAVPAVTGIAEVRKTTVAENGVSGVGVSEHRVFLLGENRWEDPTRLTHNKKTASTGTVASTKTCISCRGEGRLMCLGTKPYWLR
jgi:protein disulfide-isomerase